MAYQLLAPMNVFFLLILVPAALACGAWVFDPVRTIKNSRAKWQCQLPDVLLLIGQLGLAGALVFRLEPEFSVVEEVLGLFLLWALMALMALWWYMGIRALSRGAVSDPLRRFVILGIICPVLYCWPLSELVVNPLFMVIFGNVFLVIPALMMFVLFRFCRSIVKWAVTPPPPAPPELPDQPDQPAQPATGLRSARLRPVYFSACILTSALVVVGATAPLWCDVTLGPVYYTTALRRFRGAMRRSADIPAIQAWLKSRAATIAPASGTGNTSGNNIREILEQERPECLQHLSHRAYYNNSGALRLTWGSGFGHWGLDVALPGTPMPPSTGREYHLHLSDGAWVWHEIQ